MMTKVARTTISYLLTIAVCITSLFGMNITPASAAASVSYQAHCQNVGWQSAVKDGATAGTTGKSQRLECLKIKVSNVSGGVSISAHLASIGWKDYTSADAGKWATAGTTGEARAIEAVRIKLYGKAADAYDITYRVYSQNIGWGDYVTNGAVAGTTGKGLRAEAIQIKLVKKTTTAYSCKTPKISGIKLTESGVKIAWGKVSGAAKYRVFRKTASSKWTKVGDTTATTLTDKKVSGGVKYTYTVRCINKNGTAFTSDYDRTGKTVTYYATPTISKLECTDKGVRISWSKVKGVSKYRVFVKNGSSWVKIIDTTATSCVHVGVKTGTKYTYTVRGLSSNGKAFLTAYATKGKSITYSKSTTDMPRITKLTETSSGVRITWSTVSGVKNYRLFLHTGTGWKKLKDTTSNSYTHINVKHGNLYTYTVRGLSDDGKSYTTSYDTSGKSITYLGESPNRTQCYKCHGRGYTDCRNCNGTGKVMERVPGSNKYEKVRCRAGGCFNGHVRCTLCNETGYLD